MTSLKPRRPYSQDELRTLYPEGLELQQVQVLLRHGERSPVSARFQNAGLAVFWPYCTVARKLVNSTLEVNKSGDGWSSLQWRRRIETFGSDDRPVLASGPNGEIDSICNLGELTDTGRTTTYNLGQRLRHLYVDQLNFMPQTIQNTDMIYLRATPIPRALESLQQTFWGMYPSETRSPSLPPVTIITRTNADEILFPNEGNCKRFSQLSRAFAQRTADRWNDSDEMEYLNKIISKWMPETSKRVAVDSHPRLSGIMDTINSTLAHGPETRLPKEFYDAKGRALIEKIGVEEWFSGYQESREYRALGIGRLMGDLVQRMLSKVEKNVHAGHAEVSGKDESTTDSRGSDKNVKLALSGCHDTTLAAVLASLGTFDEEPWPPYTSHVALELFKKQLAQSPHFSAQQKARESASPSGTNGSNANPGWFVSLFSDKDAAIDKTGIGRKKIEVVSEPDRSKLDSYFVRVRYNDKVMAVPGCAKEGNHLDGDETFCTLEAFKKIVDKFVPACWQKECRANLDAPAIPAKVEPAGY